jgi:ABC-type transport system involved in cytochrome bd biosynthesis fused ATPase/permease subunit
VITARLGNAFPTLVSWAVDGVAMVLAGLLALPLVTALLAYSLGPAVLVPLGVAGVTGGLLTMASARRVERAWTLAWERSRELLVDVHAGHAGAVELRAHGRSRAFAERLRGEAARWSAAEGKARIESTLATWGALIGTLGAGLGAGVLLGARLAPGRDLYQTFLLVLAAIPTLQTLVSGAGNVLRARDELGEAGRQLELAREAGQEESDEALDAGAEIALAAIDYAYPAAGEGPGVPALRALDLRLPAKGSVAIVGPNGAGKTTLLQLLLGVLQPDRGTIRVGGQPARLDNRGFRERIAFVSQKPFELPEASVAENLRAFDGGPSDAALVAALDTVGLWPLLRGRAESDALALTLPLAQLSSGQKRRVMLARALLRDADLLVLDEPEAHLDAASVEQLSALLTRLARERRIVAVVHDRALTGFADQVITLEAPAGDEG